MKTGPAPIRRDSAATRARPGTQHHDALMRDPARHGAEVTGRNLDEDDPDAVGVLDPHLDQTPGLSSCPLRIGTPTPAAASRACSA
jgi:hypothetical protein